MSQSDMSQFNMSQSNMSQSNTDHYIEKTHVIHSFSPDHRPVCRVKAGDTVVFETYDCHMGQLLPEGSDFAHVDHRLANPATGQIGRASCRERGLRLCRSRWSPYH